MTMQFVGVDPGQVHTGVVRFNVNPYEQKFSVVPTLIQGLDVTSTKDAVLATAHPFTFIEAYRPRSHFGGDAAMQQFIHELRAALQPGVKVLDNTGVKQIVTKQLMEVFGVWNFSQRTHHQDLRSAARIGLYGALKDEQFNSMLYEMVNDHLGGRPWKRVL